jgi:hypothetical protein
VAPGLVQITAVVVAQEVEPQFLSENCAVGVWSVITKFIPVIVVATPPDDAPFGVLKLETIGASKEKAFSRVPTTALTVTAVLRLEPA